MKGEILSVGTELLLGQLVDTNAPYLARSLSGIGVDVFWISQTGDNQSRLVQTLRRAWERSDLVVISGGLGPTEDDVTREAIAELLGEKMVVKPELEAQLRAYFARRGRTMPDRNIKQATVIPSATPIPNPIGTAPGWWVERDGRIIVAMPGVPVEMKRMWEEDLLPRLSSLSGGTVILSRTLKTLGIGESSVEQELKEFTPSANPTVATYAKQDGVHVRLTAKAVGAEAAGEMLAGLEARVRGVLGSHIYGVDDETVSDAVAALLSERGLTLVTMEACTAGQLSAALGSAAVGGERFLGGLVAHDPSLLAQFGVDPALVSTQGPVSELTVRGMAVAARQRLGADVGLATVCGTDGDSASGQHQAVVFCAVDDRGEVISSTSRYSTTQRDAWRRAVLDALDLLRRRLLCQK